MSAQTRSRRLEALSALFLVLLVTAGAALRFTDINWDRFQHVHPDERFVVWVADTLSWPPDLKTALDPALSTINPFRWPAVGGTSGPLGSLAGQPRNYAYGHLPLYLLFVVARLAQGGAIWLGETTLAFPALLQPLHTVGRHLAEYAYLPLVGRTISAVADLGTLVLVYAMARRLAASDAGRRRPVTVSESPGTSWQVPLAGLLAASGYAFAVLPLQLSHYATVDAVLTFFVTAAVALAARYAEAGGRAAWLLAGAMAGLAVGSKFSAVLLAVSLLAASLYRLPEAPVQHRLVAIAKRLLVAGATAAITFLVTNPFALIELGAYAKQILAQQAMVSGVMDAPYTRQYIGTAPYWYFIRQLSQWGLGWPLGIAAWGGLVWAVLVFARRRTPPALGVMLAWALPYFASTGAFHAKFLRYMAPLLPLLLVFAACGAVALLSRLSSRYGSRGRAAWAGAALVVLLTTAGWAYAFTEVYRQEHPWIAASEWIYRNVPADSKLLTEQWDDALPLTLDEIAGRPARRRYDRIELPLWNADTPEKLDLLVSELSTADYIVLASNRLYAPIQRLQAEYPMSSQYYRMLFAGELGYRLVAEFASYPRIGSVTIPDDHADESFTVYDHPRVFILENRERLKPAVLRTRLGRYLPVGVAHGLEQGEPSESRPASGESSVRMRARPPGLAQLRRQDPAPGAPLTLNQPVDTLPVVADFRWNGAASTSSVLAAFLWWLAVSAFGWLSWPLLFPIAGGLSDRGYGLARAFGWLLVGWVHWLGVSLGLWQNGAVAIALILLSLAIAGRLAWRQQHSVMWDFGAARWRLLLAEEALFGLAFFALVLVRLLNPDLWQPWNGGEKFMEMAFLNATLRSAFFPPYDPYFAGGIVNYYYYGLYLVTLPVKLTGIVPEVSFNLATPAFFGLTAAGVFSVGYTLAEGAGMGRASSQEAASPLAEEASQSHAPRPGVAATLSATLALLMGNLLTAGWLLRNLGRLLTGRESLRFDYWAASRVIPYTINEFPLWTFVFADLHPHLIAMPFGVLVIGLALNWLGSRHPGSLFHDAIVRRRRARMLLQYAVLVLALGAVAAINTWDLPTYALMAAGTLVIAGWREHRIGAIAGTLAMAGLAAPLGLAGYWGFFARYDARVGGDGVSLIGRYLDWIREGSPAGAWLAIWGFFVLLALVYVAGGLRGWNRASRAGGSPGSRSWLVGVLILVGALALLAAAGRPTAALAALPVCLALPLVARRKGSVADNFVAMMIVIGLGIVAGTELVYLRDFLEGGEWYRMNTLFKFPVPAWLLLGTAGGVMLARVWSRSRLWWPVARLSWRGLMALLLAAGLMFLVVGVPARAKDRFPGPRPGIGTLDGMAYMTVGHYDWPDSQQRIYLDDEYLAIRWLLANVKGTPVVAEAPAGVYDVGRQQTGYDYYRAGGLRVASLTGFPTFVGHHQYEQRPADQVGPRTQLGMEFFQTTDIARTRALVDQLRVGYIYVGTLERILFSQESLSKFEAMVNLGHLTVAYRNSHVVIYRVVQ